MNKIKQFFKVAIIMLICQIFALKIYQNCPVVKDINYFESQNKVVIGSVYCRPNNIPIENDKYFAQITVMLKSAIISAHLYNISTIETHLFLEHPEDQPYFDKVLKQMTIPKLTVSLQVYSAVDKVPKNYQNHMIFHKRYRCGYVRFYFPEVLTNLDSIIYLDSDLIVTGDLMQYWKLLSKMDSHQMIAAAQDSPTENKKYFSAYNTFFKPVPHVPPRGVNSGLLVMNLTRMREFKMSEKITRVYQDYSKTTTGLSDQLVLNVLLYYNPGLLLSMPCNFNFMGPQCEEGFYCQAALQDPDGIHTVHGTSRRFMEGRVFSPIYMFYKKLNISVLLESGDVADLLRPIRSVYSKSSGKGKNRCSGVLGEVLFKRFVN